MPARGRAGLDFAFTELAADEVVAFTEPDNQRSRAVMHRLGMRYVKRIIHRDLEKVLYVSPSTMAPAGGSEPAPTWQGGSPARSS
jgi:hypothetical protein